MMMSFPPGVGTKMFLSVFLLTGKQKKATSTHLHQTRTNMSATQPQTQTVTSKTTEEETFAVCFTSVQLLTHLIQTPPTWTLTPPTQTPLILTPPTQTSLILTPPTWTLTSLTLLHSCSSCHSGGVAGEAVRRWMCFPCSRQQLQCLILLFSVCRGSSAGFGSGVLSVWRGSAGPPTFCSVVLLGPQCQPQSL